MRGAALLRIALVLTVLIALSVSGAQGPIRAELEVKVAMRDGVELSTNVFLPATAGRVPALLIRTPYGKGAGLSPTHRAFVEHGYAVVIQDVRGRYGSEGTFDPLHQEITDGEDTLSWIAHQDWSTRRIGMMGGSYVGIVQWKAALSGSPYLKAIFPAVAGSDEYFDRFYSPGGALKLAHRLEWMAETLHAPGYVPNFAGFTRHVPLRTSDQVATGQTIDFFQKALDHPAYDAYWRSISTREHLDRVHIPVFIAGGWYDNFVESDLEAFRRLRERGAVSRIVIGPWPHNFGYPFKGVDYGPEAKTGLRKLQFDWFDYWLKDTSTGPAPGSVVHPPVRIFVMGANRWRDEEEWPLQRARATDFYLSGKGQANSVQGDGRLAVQARTTSAPDEFVYNPQNPVPTVGGAICCNPKLLPWGPMDQRLIEKRKDVLVYTTAPLEWPLEVTGPVRAVLYVSTSAPDTDFTAKLVDVFPDGRARNLCDGLLRLRYRDSLEHPALVKAGEVYAVTIDAGVTSNEFAKGHRIRLEVSSSNFPRFDRNPNTGRKVADEQEFRRAVQRVYHDRGRPSRLVLPVVPQ